MENSLLSSVVQRPDFGQLPVLDLATTAAKSQLTLHGGHLLRWAPAGADDVIWVSPNVIYGPGTPIRGGVPICYPWFGPMPSVAGAPAHGYARTSLWQLDASQTAADGTVTLRLSLPKTAQATQWINAGSLDATLEFRLGTSLEMTLAVVNHGPAEFSLEAAIHTYLAVSDVEKISLTGLEGTEYLDKVLGGTRARLGAEPFRLTGETDRVHLDTRADCVIHDPGLRRRLVIGKTGSDATVVWNPWSEKSAKVADLGEGAWRGFLCVEAANAAENRVVIAPGSTHRLTQTVRVEPLA